MGLFEITEPGTFSTCAQQMPKFRKILVVIEACLWDEKRSTLEKIGCSLSSCSSHRDRPDECTNLRIKARKGTVPVKRGDYIIKGVNGEFYPCKPDIFEATYEAVD